MRPREPLSRLKLTRRQLLGLLVALSAWLPARILLAAVPTGGSPSAPQNLSALLDVLLPEDESPSASQLGVDARILAEASGNPNLMRLLDTGSTWLDRQARRQGAQAFHQLDEEHQIGIVKLAEAQPQPSLVQIYFRYVQDRAFNYYYAHPESWPSLGYVGPPQPRGFPDYDRPPRDLTS